VNSDIVAFDIDKLQPLWHAHIGNVQNAPETYMLDGHQYILVAASGSVYAFYLQ
jgi:alcohol dehydrogenase (cytochrome c)